MKKITINIPDDYADVISVTAIGGAGTRFINVKSTAVDITGVTDEAEFDIFEGVIKSDK